MKYMEKYIFKKISNPKKSVLYFTDVLRILDEDEHYYKCRIIAGMYLFESKLTRSMSKNKERWNIFYVRKDNVHHQPMTIEEFYEKNI